MILGVTPEMASDWLSTRRWPNQRSRSNSIVSKYMKDMKEGRWKLTRQGLIFDSEGYNIDGQHRLWAVANLTDAELTAAYGHPWVEFWVYPNEPTDTFDAYDQNFRRIAAHLINEPNSVMLAAGARFLAAVSDLDPWSFPRFGRLTTSEVLRTKDEWPELSHLVPEVVGVKNRVYVHAPSHLAVLAQASRSELGTPEKIASWFEVLRTGVTANPNDPRLKLRDKFLRDHGALGAAAFRPLVYSLIVKAWNAHAKGEDLPTLRWMNTERIPTVEGFSFTKTEEQNA
jgi:hypothetical protein